MTGQSGGETRHESGIGSRLRSARERSGLTVERAAQKLHLDPAILQALEAEDFDSLGAPIYIKGYLGRYAELVGESAESLQQMLSSTVIPPPDLTRIPRARARESRLVGPIAIVIAVATLVVVSSLWWGISRWRERHPVLLESRTVPRELPPRRVTQRTPAAAEKPPGAAPVRSGTPAAGGADRVSRSPSGASKGEVRITLKFSAPSWLEVDDASGRQLYHSMTPAAAVRVFQGAAPLHVVLGYAPAVTLTVDGHATRMGPLAQADHAASFEITADGRILSGRHAGGE